MMRIKKKSLIGTSKKSAFLILVFIAAIFIGVGYSYLSSGLAVNGTTQIAKSTWNVHFANPLVTEGSVENGSVSITEDATIVNFQVPLEKPGDFYEFSIDVVNSGTIDAMIGNIINSGLTAEQQKYLEYSVLYESGDELKINDPLTAGNNSKIIIKVKYKDDALESNLPTEDQNLNLTFNINYVQRED